MKIRFKPFVKISLFTWLSLLLTGLLVNQNLMMPVKGATNADYNPESYWYYPWGKSVTHKGVDIFSKINTPIYSSTKGLVLATGKTDLGGNYVLTLGPKWRIHYYAHLNSINCKKWDLVNHSSKIGTVGNSGNAKGKSPHLHYAIVSIIPYVWKIDHSVQGWKKMFYLNPISYLKKSQ